jgi:probable F420-dependent oxidoreductase
MKPGVTYFPTEYSITPADLARAAEERGFESLWVAEHSHIPAAREAPWPGGAELPQMYYDVMDPFVALASAAAVTTRLRLGTGICLVAQRDPIQTAKQVASLDRLSNGRFLFGVGAGWNFEEMANHAGHAFERRFKVLRERVEAMKALWTDDPAEYHGEFVDFEPAHARPKPVQKPHPPIHVGGGFPGAARRAIRWGDGWMPILGRGDEDVVALAPAFRRMAEDADRDPSELEISVYGSPRDPAGVAALRDAGVDRIVMLAPPAHADDVLPRLDQFAALAAEAG